MNGPSYVAGELRRAGVPFRMKDSAFVATREPRPSASCRAPSTGCGRAPPRPSFASYVRRVTAGAPENGGVDEVISNRGYHSNATLVYLRHHGIAAMWRNRASGGGAGSRRRPIRIVRGSVGTRQEATEQTANCYRTASRDSARLIRTDDDLVPETSMSPMIPNAATSSSGGGSHDHRRLGFQPHFRLSYRRASARWKAHASTPNTSRARCGEIRPLRTSARTSSESRSCGSP